MTRLRKISALVLAVMMIAVVGLAYASSAEDMTGKSGVIGEFQSPDTPDTPAKQSTIQIYKEITAYNPETCTVNAPAITFSYTISHSDALAGKSIQDDESHHDPAASSHVLTKQGVGTPTITGTAAGELTLSPTVTTDRLNASVNGTANRFPLTISFAGIDFTTDGTGAGVYRYRIDETTTETIKNASGIKEGTVANTLYIDVYVNGSGQIYGYVLSTTNSDIDASGTETDTTAATAVGKTEGFVGTQPDDGTYASEAASTADKYYTFNLEVEKEVLKDNYVVTNEIKFPFTITLTNSTVTENVLPIMTFNDETLVSQTALSSGAIAGTWAPSIASGGKVTYKGIPCGTTINIYETNTVSGATYTSLPTNYDKVLDAASGTETTTPARNIGWVAPNNNSNIAQVNCGSTALAVAAENHTSTAATAKQVKFTNTLLEISPTGIVLRVAPYLLMLAGGIALLVIFMVKRRKHTEE